MFINPINNIRSRKQYSGPKFQNNSLKTNSKLQQKLLKNKNVSFGTRRAAAFFPSSNYIDSSFEKNLAKHLKLDVVETKTKPFANTELYVRMHDSVVNFANDVAVIVQTMGKSVNDSLMELLLKTDAAHEAGIDDVYAVLPYMPYARGERTTKRGESVPLKVTTTLLKSLGIKRCFVGDIHSESSLAGADYGLRMHNVPLNGTLSEHFKLMGLNPEKTVVLSPDMGGYKRANTFVDFLDPECDTAVIDKVRPKANVSEVRKFFGDVEGKDVILVDDMVDTAGSITNAANFARDNGAERVFIAAGHGLFNGDAVKNLNNANIDGIVVTNTMNIPPEVQKSINNLTVIDASKPFADKINQFLGRSTMTI